MATNIDDNSVLANLLGDLQHKWGWLLALGIAFVLLGFIGLGMTFALTMVSMLFFGFLMVFGGVFQLLQSWHCKGWKSIALHILVALAYLVGGVIFINQPLIASSIITMMIAVVLISVGALRIVMAVQLKSVKNWWLPLISGILSVIFGAMIMTSWPLSGMWIIGLLIAVDMVFHGFGYIALALAAKDMAE